MRNLPKEARKILEQMTETSKMIAEESKPIVEDYEKVQKALREVRSPDDDTAEVISQARTSSELIAHEIGAVETEKLNTIKKEAKKIAESIEEYIQIQVNNKRQLGISNNKGFFSEPLQEAKEYIEKSEAEAEANIRKYSETDVEIERVKEYIRNGFR